MSWLGSPGRLPAWLALTGLVLTATVAARGQSAPQELPDALLRSDGPLETDEIEAIDQYVAYWVGLLCDGDDPPRLAEARRHLLRPITGAGSSDAVAEAATRLLVDGLRGCMTRGDRLARTNVMITAMAVARPEVTDLCVLGLADGASGVRYWSARAIVRAGGAIGGLDEARQRSVLAALKLSMARETDAMLLERMYEALGTLDIPEARPTYRDILAQRLSIYREGITPALRADRRAMDGLRADIIARIDAGQNVDSRLRGLAEVTARYLRLAVSEAHAERVKPELMGEVGAVVGSAEATFGYALRHFGGAAGGPPLVAVFDDGELDLLFLNVLEWIGTDDRPGLLTTTGVGIPVERLR